MNLLTLREVAEYLKVSESTVRRWIRSGFLAAYGVGKRGQVRVRQEELDTFLENQRIGARTADAGTEQTMKR